MPGVAISAGALDRRITLQRAQDIPNAFNEGEPNWVDLATVWASKEDVSDAERSRAGQTEAVITTRFQVRLPDRRYWAGDGPDLNPKDRLVYGRTVYAIVAVKEIGYRERLEISATARADQG